MKQEYIKRRKILQKNIGSGMIFLPGNNLVPMNYPSNPLPFRQDSTILYFTGIDKPGIFIIMDCDSGEEILFGNDLNTDDLIWTGPQLQIALYAESAGIKKYLPVSHLFSLISKENNIGRRIHYLPPYPADRKILLSSLLEISLSKLDSGVSVELINAIVKLRSIKSPEEINEIETVLNEVTRPLHIESIKSAIPGKFEYDIAAIIRKTMQGNNVNQAYPIICTVRGEFLHNDSYNNQLKSGQLLLIDAAAESSLHYASDITRTCPIGGKFTAQQKEIYELVLSSQMSCIEMMKPGIRYLDVHMKAAKIIASGLKSLGIMKGDVDEAIESGAHALFFPHGLGHMLGLDVHDMEDYGEDYVGYNENIKRSNQFGKAYLRFARELETGFVLTVEPGIYFIPMLIDKWQAENKLLQFINYEKLINYKRFGGIRIEDNILITQSGNRVLGESIPKTISEIENLMNI